MNLINHFLASIILLFIFLNGIVSIQEMILFTVIFALLTDIDVFIKYLLKVKQNERRTFIQEPFGLLIIGLPIAILLSYLFKPYYFFLVLIPYSSHIILDYISEHTVSPWAPFSKKKVKTGFICHSLDAFKSKFNEAHFFIISLIVFILLIT